MSILNRFPSFDHLFRNAVATLWRFPFVLASAAFGTIVAMYLIEAEPATPPPVAMRLLLCSGLGISLFVALSTYAERRSWQAGLKRAFPAVGLLGLGIYYVTLPGELFTPYEHLMRYFLLAVGLHYLVAFLPYLGKGQANGFWQYNKTLFIRFLVAAIFSSVLFTGLAIAVAAADHLFGMDVDEKIYMHLWAVIAGVFNTWVFLAGVPRNLAGLNDSDAYPTGLKVFAQYILLPLVGLYFVILIVYEAKILATWDWPKGLVSQLVLWYSVVGILSLLLLYPLRLREGNRWIAVFGTWFFRALVPLVVMLHLAIYVRIADYGITVNRYLVVGLAVGLTLVVIYFVFGRARDIRIIPIVLCALAFLAAYGPLSAFSVSQSSQRQRLETYLTDYGILSEGVIRETTQKTSYEDRKEMSSIVSYLCSWHGPSAFAGWVDNSTIAAWQDSVSSYLWRDSVTRRLGFAYVDSWRSTESGEHFDLRVETCERTSLIITGYDVLIELRYGGHGDETFAFPLPDDTCFIQMLPEQSALRVALGQRPDSSGSAAELRLAEPITKMMQYGSDYLFGADELTFDLDGTDRRIRFVFQNLSGSLKADTVTTSSLQAWVLISER